MDRVAVEYKTARADYQDARKKARQELRAQFIKRRDELGKGKPSPKDKALKEYDDQLRAFVIGPGKSQDTGPLPTHPVMATAVAAYWQALETALQKFGAVAEKGLAAYAKAGVTDLAKLRPLQSASLAAKHPDLFGIWSSGGGMREQDVWVVDVDEATGGWWVDGSMNYNKVSTGHLYHAEKIKFDAGTLSFEARPVDTSSKTVRGAGSAVSLKLEDGKLFYTWVNARGKPVSKTLVRSGEEMVRATIEYWGVPKAGADGPGAAPETPDPANPNYVWRRHRRAVLVRRLPRKVRPGRGRAVLHPGALEDTQLNGRGVWRAGRHVTRPRPRRGEEPGVRRTPVPAV